MALLTLLLVSGCVPGERACTAIGTASGVSVTVDRSAASTVRRLSLRVCWDLESAAPVCRTGLVALMPGYDSIDRGCDSSEPDAACSATAVPNGSKVGFLQLDELREGPITVAATATMARQRTTVSQIEVAAHVTYPNGPDCGAGSPQATVTLDSDGLR